MNSTEDFTSTLSTSTPAFPPESDKEVTHSRGLSGILVAEDLWAELQAGGNIVSSKDSQLNMFLRGELMMECMAAG